MIQLIKMCFDKNTDGDLIYAVKCYMHSYHELYKPENFNKIYKLSQDSDIAVSMDGECDE